MGENEQKPGTEGSAASIDAMQWVWLGLGAVMAVVGGSLKARDVMVSPAVFEYVFFSGSSYILMVAGLALTIIALGYDLVFGSGGEDS
ncbi:MAG TPA: hypothetical protein VM658_08740 [bacterium]|nr:hypothetical protein [bacterium]